MKDVKRIIHKRGDPLGVRETASLIVSKAENVKINFTKLNELSGVIKNEVGKLEKINKIEFGSQKKSLQKIFILNCLNFCFWPEIEGKRWRAEFPKGQTASGGWFSLVGTIDNALEKGMDITDSSFLSKLSLSQAENIFVGLDGVQIPLIKERVDILNVIGNVLTGKFDGRIENLLENTTDVSVVTRLVSDKFPFLQNDQFYKSVQNFAYDFAIFNEFQISGLGSLTVFADYKLPQMLRSFGVLKYSKELSSKVDNKELIKKGSPDELEIRSSTIITGEMLADKCDMLPVFVDSCLWHASQSNQNSMLPHHRIITTFY